MTDMTAKASANYTQEMVDTISSDYSANPTRATVDALAEKFDKTPRSIIAKLSALGIYVKAERVTKRGEPVVRKDELVAQVQSSFGRELPSLNKMTKVDLQNIIEFFAAA
jgi:hypothetical protein|tara:strand:+ start:400 stop:729 length:330 start_codon:yes stop_codon:yes gene_type:complete